jgi:hypothetical protein
MKKNESIEWHRTERIPIVPFAKFVFIRTIRNHVSKKFDNQKKS